MRVDIYETRGDDGTVDVDGVGSQFVDVAAGDDASVTYADVSAAACRTGTVDDLGVTHEQVEHRITPWWRWPIRAPGRAS